MKTNRRIQLTVAALFIVIAALSQSADVSVNIQPKTFPSGSGAQLSVTADGSFDEQPNPEVPSGVTIRPYGQSRNVRIVNGRMSQTITQNYVISADQPGDYTIPSFEVKVGGKRVSTDPVNFSVTATSTPQIGNPQSQSGGAQTSTGEAGFLRLDFPKRNREHLYVGEMAPVRIKAYFPENSRIAQLSSPNPQGLGFTLHNISDQPEKGTEIVNGKRYRTVTWFAGISVAKAGEYPVTVGVDATVLVAEKSSQRRHRSNPFGSIFGGNSPFNDPFFDDFFDNAFTQSVPRELKLTSPGDPLTIKSLPREGRPGNFSGAVGEFTMGGYLLPAEAKTGEPQKIRVTINGKGNFDRLSAPNLEPADNWKTYKPKTEFKPGDVASFSGSKSFDFNAVPQKGGDQSVSLSFSFFNTNTEKYETVNSQEINLFVAGKDVKTTAQISATPLPRKKPAAVVDTPKPQSGLAPDRPNQSGHVAISPLIISTGYWVVAGLACLGIIGGFVLRSIKDQSNDPVRIAARQSHRQEQEALKLAGEAARNGNISEFFAAARKSLQERYSQIWDRPSEAITMVELKQQLPADSPAIQIIAKADEISYAPESETSGIDLEPWLKRLHEAHAATAETA